MLRPTKKSRALFAAALLANCLNHTDAGELIAKSTGAQSATEKAPESNPLSFFGGAVVFDLQERLRFEARENNFDFDSKFDSLTDDSWLLNRVRLGLLIKPSDWFNIYAQGQDAREFFSDRPKIPGVLGAEGDDAFDLRQGYIEIGNAKQFPLTLKVGRQELSYGDERLIGTFDWNNFSRTFDAVKLRWEEKNWSLDAFASSVAVIRRGSYNQSDLFNGNETGRAQVFSGLYFSTTALGAQTIDLYALDLHENLLTRPEVRRPVLLGPGRTRLIRITPAILGDTDFGTFGLRIKSKPGAFAHVAPTPDGKAVADGKSAPAPVLAPKPVGLDYDFEGAFQTGEVRGLDLTAFAVHAGAGYTFDVPWTPRLGLQYNFASGDHDPFDGTIETFQNLFPTNHKFYGIMDLTAWQNMHQAVAELKVQPVKQVTAQLDYRAFFIASNDDFWYRANGTTAVRPLTPAARDAGQFEGSQIEFITTWNVCKYFQLQGGYAHFFAGDYLKDTGPHDDADFGYVQATFTF